MELPVWVNNLIAYSLQIAILASAGTLLAYLFRLRMPRVTVLYWQSLLLACLCLPLLQRWDHPFVRRAVSGTAEARSAISGLAVSIGSDAATLIPWTMVGLFLAAGIILRLLWLLVGFFRLRLFHRKSRLFLEEYPAIRDMQWRTGVRASLLLSSEIDSPVTFGFRPPAIILPLSFKELNEPCQRAVLCHELLHVRRYDWALILLEEIVRSLFWFHPAIWWLIGRIQLSREQAVDHEVVQLTGSKQPYLDSLLEFARAQGRPRAVPAPLFLKERHLVQRVALLLKEVSMSRSRLTVSMIGISVLLVCTVRLAAGWFPFAGAPVPLHEESVTWGGLAPPVEVPASAQEKRVEPKVKAPQREPLRVGGNVQESKLIQKVEPVYPEQAKREHIQGTIKLTVTINEEGLVYEIKTGPGNNPLLEEAAISAVEQWRYSPTLLNGKPAPVVATVTVTFRLKDGPSPAEDQKGRSEVKSVPGEGLQVGGNFPESRLIHRVEPVYPEKALKARVQGKVVLKITVNKEGYVTDAQVLSGHPTLDEAAIAAVKQWQYSPTLLNGEPVPVIATVTVVFNLK